MKNVFKKIGRQKQEPVIDVLPDYIGFVDNHWGPLIRGWAFNKAEPKQPVYVRICGENIDTLVKADQYRADIKDKALHPTGLCGFTLKLPSIQPAPVTVSVIKEMTVLGSSSPLFKGRKLFFMHIAKTAGSSVNKQISAHYQEDQYLFHIEGEQDWQPLKNKLFISGHITLPRFEKVFEKRDYVLFTFLRNPLDQLVSHLYWVRHLCEPGIEQFKATHPAAVQRLSEKLSLIDFTDKAQLKNLVDNLTNIEAPLFDNCQCRYFHPIPANQRYSNESACMALKNLDKFEIIGITEQYQKTMGYLADVMGWDQTLQTEIRANVNRFDYGIDKDDEEVKQILNPLIQYDQLLYKAGQKKFNQLF